MHDPAATQRSSPPRRLLPPPVARRIRPTASRIAAASLGCLALNLPSTAAASFIDPADADWGGWARGAEGSAYVHWDVFDACTLSGSTCLADPDFTPDVANIGTSTAILDPLAESAFITGGGLGGSIYSFSETQAFEVFVALPSSAFGTTTLALQVDILGTDLDDDAVRLDGERFDEKRVLREGDAGGPFGGIDNTYLYLFVDVPAAQSYSLDLSAESSSLSLGALAVDIAPPSGGGAPPPPDPPGGVDVAAVMGALLPLLLGD